MLQCFCAVTETKQDNQKRHHPGKLSFFSRVVNAVLLILIGSILLLNNFDYLPWDIWKTLIQFWPVLIIFWGLQILAGGNLILNFFFSLLSLSLIGLIVLISLVISNENLRTWLNQNYPQVGKYYLNILPPKRSLILSNDSQKISVYEFQNVEAVSVAIKTEFGKFKVSDNTSDYFLWVNSKTYDNKSRPDVSRKKIGDILEMDIDYTRNKPQFMKIGEQIEGEILFGQPNIPTDLHLTIGAGDLSSDFDTLYINKLRVELGVGKVELKLSPHSIPKQNSEISIGAGKASISIPENVGLKIEYTVGIGN